MAVSHPTVAQPQKNGVISVACYNIHRCIGRDRRRDPDRVARVIRTFDADVIGLQEVASTMETAEDSNQLEYLARRTGLQGTAGPTIISHKGSYGNGLLTSLPVLSVQRIDLSVPRREPRGGLVVDLDWEGAVVRVAVTHLGLVVRERRFQIEELLKVLLQEQSPTIILMGDFNEWLAWRRQPRLLRELFADGPKPRTYPARWPLFALDRIWVRPQQRLIHLEVVDTPLSRVASDHLPLKAIVSCPDPPDAMK